MMSWRIHFLARIDGIPPFRPGPVAEMLFVPLGGLCRRTGAGRITHRSDTGRTHDGDAEQILCCLHTEEWQGAKPRIEALLTERTAAFHLTREAAAL